MKYKGFVLRLIHPAVGDDIVWIIDPEFDNEYVATADSIEAAKKIIDEFEEAENNG